MSVKIKDVNDISFECEEGKLLIAAIAFIQSNTTEPNVTPDVIINKLYSDFEFIIAKYN